MLFLFLQGIESCLCSAAYVTGEVNGIPSLSEMSARERIDTLASALRRGLLTRHGDNEALYSQLGRLCDRITSLIQFIYADEDRLMVKDNPPTLSVPAHVLTNVKKISANGSMNPFPNCATESLHIKEIHRNSLSLINASNLSLHKGIVISPIVKINLKLTVLI